MAATGKSNEEREAVLTSCAVLTNATIDYTVLLYRELALLVATKRARSSAYYNSRSLSSLSPAPSPKLRQRSNERVDAADEGRARDRRPLDVKRIAQRTLDVEIGVNLPQRGVHVGTLGVCIERKVQARWCREVMHGVGVRIDPLETFRRLARTNVGHPVRDGKDRRENELAILIGLVRKRAEGPLPLTVIQAYAFAVENVQVVNRPVAVKAGGVCVWEGSVWGGVVERSA